MEGQKVGSFYPEVRRRLEYSSARRVDFEEDSIRLGRKERSE